MTDLTENARKVIAAGEKATARPWRNDCGETCAYIPSEGEECILIEHGYGYATDKDFEFVVTACNHAPALAARVLELEELENLTPYFRGLEEDVIEARKGNLQLSTELALAISDVTRLRAALERIKDGPGNKMDGWKKTWAHEFAAKALGDSTQGEG